jgi:hypothetical protein
MSHISTHHGNIPGPLLQALTNADAAITARIVRETRYISEIKSGINHILTNLGACAVAAVAAATAAGVPSTAFDAIRQDVDLLTDSLNSSQPFTDTPAHGQPNMDAKRDELLNPLRDYRPNLKEEQHIGTRPLLDAHHPLFGGWTPNKKTKRRRKNRM